MRFLTALFFLVFSLAIPGAEAQQTAKHPRAIELESFLTKVTSDFLKGRFPSAPFTAVVSVDPLHRYGDYDKAGKAEALPFLENEDSKPVDEWDDPAWSLPGLVLRCKRVVVSISVPSEVKEDDIAEIERSLSALLNLVPARDQIKIQKREWGQKTPDSMSYAKYAFWMFYGFLVLTGIYLIADKFNKKFASTIAEKNASTNSGNNSNLNLSSTKSSPSVATSVPSTLKKNSNQDSDQRFIDPLKVKEALTSSIQSLLSHKSFPTLSDMIYLDKMASENHSVLGAFLTELPIEKQKEIFSLSYTKPWLDSFIDPGEMNNKVLDFVQKLMRQHRDESQMNFQRMLISVWRMGPKMTEFLRSLSNEEAFSILYHLPKKISIMATKQAFPGQWAFILDSEYKSIQFTESKIKEITEKAFKFIFPRKFKAIDEYRQLREILDMLEASSPDDERDIYLTLPKSSMLFEIRPPFYPILEISEEQAKEFVPSLNMDMWTYCLFNVPRDKRKFLENIFTEKQTFLFREKMKKLDANPPPPTVIEENRQAAARFYVEFIKVWNMLFKEPNNEATNTTFPKAA